MNESNSEHLPMSRAEHSRSEARGSGIGSGSGFFAAAQRLSRLILRVWQEFIQLIIILTDRRAPSRFPINAHRPPIVFIHGLWGRAGDWNRPLNQLRALGGNRLGNFYPTSLPGCNRRVEDDVALMTARLLELSEAHGQPLQLVGHSRGGLIALLSADRLLKEHKVVVRSVVTIASPLRGAALAGLGARFLGVAGRFLGDLAPASQALMDGELASQRLQSPILHLVANRDLLVAPDSAHLEGNEIARFETGHLGILTHRDVIKRLCDWLIAPPEKVVKGPQSRAAI